MGKALVKEVITAMFGKITLLQLKIAKQKNKKNKKLINDLVDGKKEASFYYFTPSPDKPAN